MPLNIHSGDLIQTSNDTKGLRTFLRWIGRQHAVHVVFEATGPFHRQLESHLAKAMRHNPDLRSIYLSPKDKGKHAKVALTALMRRLVILANVLLRNDRLWEPRHT